MYAAATGTMVLQQARDEVSGTYGGSSSNTLTGVVSDFRLNGEYVSGGSGRFSFAMTEDNSQLSGNFAPSPTVGQNYIWQPQQWCGGRGATGALPATCLGGGGPFDGSWFTNLGVITLAQAFVKNAPGTAVTGLWYFYNDTAEYSIGTMAVPSTANGPSIAWTDNSVLGGGQQLTTFDGLTLSNGYRNSPVDAPWCGVIIGTNSSGNPQVGVLPNGCGLTAPNWALWQSQGGTSQPATLLQHRGLLSGTVGSSSPEQVTGSVGYDPDGGYEDGYVAATGTWTGSGTSGTFSWYPGAFPGSFAGDSTAAGGTESPWCGAASGALEPNPCLQ
jgi:hypothetical protein